MADFWLAKPCVNQEGTTEPETAVFLGIEEATHGLFLARISHNTASARPPDLS